MVLKLSADGTIVFFGKMIFNLLLLLVLSILIVPLFMVLLKTTPVEWPIFLAGVVLGLIGLSGATAIIAAVVSKASIRRAGDACLDRSGLELAEIVQGVSCEYHSLQPTSARLEVC